MTKPGDVESSKKLVNEEDRQSQDSLAEHPTKYTGYVTSSGEPIMLKSKLRYGKISYRPEDVYILHPGFKVPEHITQSLLENFGDISQAEVKIVSDPQNDHVLRWSVDPKSTRNEFHQIAANENLMLKTRIRNGEVSFSKDDLEFRCPNWEVPPYLVDSLRREYKTTSNGKLSIISDEKGNLRYTIKLSKEDRVVSLVRMPAKVL